MLAKDGGNPTPAHPRTGKFAAATSVGTGQMADFSRKKPFRVSENGESRLEKCTMGGGKDCMSSNCLAGISEVNRDLSTEGGRGQPS